LYFRKIKAFPPDAHWFCPKRNEDDHLNYDEPDWEEDGVSIATKLKYIDEGRKRQSITYRFAIVYGLPPEDAEEWQSTYRERSGYFLSTCDKCVRNYHAGRKEFVKELSE
jgi:senataxin